MIEFRIPQTPTEYTAAYDEFRWHWPTLLPDALPSRDSFPAWAAAFTWCYVVFIDDEMAGLIIVGNINNGEGEVYVCGHKRFRWYAKAVWEHFMWSMAPHLHAIHAYISSKNRRLVRLAEFYGFKFQIEGDWYHGKTQSTTTGRPGPDHSSGNG